MISDADTPSQTYKAGTIPGPVFHLKVVGGLTFWEDDNTHLGFAVTGKANPDGSLVNPNDAPQRHTTGRLHSTLPVRHGDAYVTRQRNAIWYGSLERQPVPGSQYKMSAITNLIHWYGLEGIESPMSSSLGEKSTEDFELLKYGIAFIARDLEVNQSTHTAC